MRFALVFLLVLCITITPFYPPLDECLSAEQEDLLLEKMLKCLEQRVEYMLLLNPQYDWGGTVSLDPGDPGDCSEKMYCLFAGCGFSVIRTTALNMSKGLGGWNFEIVDFKSGRKFSLIWFTVPPKPGRMPRPNGHVAVLIEDVYDGKISRMAHASLSKGFATDQLYPNSYWYMLKTVLRDFRK